MISKKNKALAAGILAAAVSASSILPTMASAASSATADATYAERFVSLYDDVITNGQANGYLSSNTNGSDSFGIPYHAVETLIVEAPDYGHETTSEALSYIVWAASMRDVLGKNNSEVSASNDLGKAWNTMEALIPGWSEAAKGSSTTVNYKSLWSQQRLKADSAPELDTPQEYPTSNQGGDALNPLYDAFKSAYGSDNGYYLMHWLADVDDWYGYGGSSNPGTGDGSLTFINTFQRGKNESCFETVPHPSIEELKYGNSSDGIKGIFNGVGNVSAQYAFTNAPDAEDRAIQAIYFANQWGVDTGDISALAGKMGDQLRNDMFDKYYKEIGCQNIWTASSGTKGQHFLMSWYTSWGGALGNYDWAWQIGCSHSHQFYQNPLAAYALLYDDSINAGMKSTGADSDYTESIKRQVEMYLWLQSANGPIAGGCTNSLNGRYEKYPSNTSTFYDMAYVEHPVYEDPGSNHWIGNQVWSVQRLVELYYYVKTNGDATNGMTFGGLSLEEALKTVIDRWANWFIDNVKFDYTDEEGNTLSYAIPSNLDWSGQPATWTGDYSATANNGLTCTITSYGQSDIGCVSSLCNSLIYYAAAEGVDASAANTEDTSSTASKGLYLANKLLSKQWDKARDDIGLSITETNGSLKRVFEESVYIPTNYTGKMPDGSDLVNGATFSSIRKSYEKDATYQELKAYYEENGDTKDFELNYHRFWHEGDALMSYGAMALLYPTVTPYDDDTSILWGDANVDGDVKISDAILILQNLADPETYPITAQGQINADVYLNGDGLNAQDALSIQKLLANQLTELPESFQ